MTACATPPEETSFKIDAAVVNGPGTLGLSLAGKPVKAVVVYFHGMDQAADVTQSDTKHKAFVAALLRARYAVVSADASGNAFGNRASRQQYRDLIGAARQKYGSPVSFFVAESMGALPALALVGEDGGRAVRGLVGISPLMGLPPRGQSISFVAGAWGGRLPPEANPLGWPPERFAGRAFALYASDTDHVVPADASAREFARRFGSVARVDVSSCTGGHVAGDCFRGDDVVAWMNSM
jgi:hypothetical protein